MSKYLDISKIKKKKNFKYQKNSQPLQKKKKFAKMTC